MSQEENWTKSATGPRCSKCGEETLGYVHMCGGKPSDFDTRSRYERVRDWALGWMKAQFHIQIGMLGLMIQIRQYMALSRNIHMLAAVFSYGSRQLGFVLERIDGKQHSLRLRLHGIWMYKEFNFGNKSNH